MRNSDHILVPLLILMSLLAAGTVHACSLAACLNHGVEVRPEFTVVMKHDGTPLAGVKVEVTANRVGDGSISVFSGITSSDGTVQVGDLAPGDYWISADLLGISAAYECFHVKQKRSRRAKRILKYEWGDMAPGTKRVEGKLLDSQPGSGGTPIWNLIHRIKVPIVGASLTLRNPLTGNNYRTTSDSEGMFAFGDIPQGTYVLQVKGGKAGSRAYDGTDQLLAVSAKARWDGLLLTRRDPAAGGCGGTTLELLPVK